MPLLCTNSLHKIREETFTESSMTSSDSAFQVDIYNYKFVLIDLLFPVLDFYSALMWLHRSNVTSVTHTHL